MTLSKGILYWDGKEQGSVPIRDDSEFDPILSNGTQEKTLLVVKEEPSVQDLKPAAWQFDSMTPAVNGDFCKVYSVYSGAYITEGYYVSTLNAEVGVPSDGPVVFETVPARGSATDGCYKLNEHVVARKCSSINKLSYVAVPEYADKDIEFSEAISSITASREMPRWSGEEFLPMSTIADVTFVSGIDLDKTNTILRGSHATLVFQGNFGRVEVLTMTLWGEDGNPVVEIETKVPDPSSFSLQQVVFELLPEHTQVLGKYSITFRDAMRPAVSEAYNGLAPLFGIMPAGATALQYVGTPGGLSTGGTVFTNASYYYDSIIVTGYSNDFSVMGQIVDGSDTDRRYFIAKLDYNYDVVWLNTFGYSMDFLSEESNFSAKSPHSLAINYETGDIFFLVIPMLYSNSLDRVITALNKVNPDTGEVSGSSYVVSADPAVTASFEGIAGITLDRENNLLYGFGKEAGKPSIFLFDTSVWTGSPDSVIAVSTSTVINLVAGKKLVDSDTTYLYTMGYGSATGGLGDTRTRAGLWRRNLTAGTGSQYEYSVISTQQWDKDSIALAETGLLNTRSDIALRTAVNPLNTSSNTFTTPDAKYSLIEENGVFSLIRWVDGDLTFGNFTPTLTSLSARTLITAVEWVEAPTMNNNIDQGSQTIICGGIKGQVAPGMSYTTARDNAYLLINML